MKFNSLLIISIIAVSIPCMLYGENQYVTQNGAGARDGSSLADAWSASNFNELSGTEYAGDTIYFSGIFSTRIVVVNIEGAAGQPLTLDGYQDGDCDPINAECISSANLLQGMEIGDNKEGPDYINVYDFRMTKSGKGSTFTVFADISEGDDEAHIDYVNIKRNYVYDSAHTMFHYDSGRYVTVENNKFKYYGLDRTYKTTQGINLVRLEDFIFRGNEVGHDQITKPGGCIVCDSACHPTDTSPCSAELIEIHGCKNLLMEYNDVYGAINQSGIRPKEDGGGVQTNLIIRYNKVHDNLGLGGLLGQGESAGKGIYARTRTTQTLSDIYIYGNMVYNNQLYGIMFGTKAEGMHAWSNVVIDNGRYGIGTWDSLLGDIHIYNNTIARNGVNGETDNSRGGIVITGDSTGTYIKNNVLWNNRPAGAGGKFNQVFSSRTLSSLEHNSYYHNSGTPNFYYDNNFRTLSEMQASPYNFEDEFPLGEITDYGFNNPNGLDNNYGTTDDDYRLNGTNINDGQDISKCFNIPIQGQTYNVCYDDALDPNNTDWTTTPPTVATVKRDIYGWDRGAYAYAGNGDTTKPAKPTGLVIIE